jgi:hypothetical protein
MAPRASLMGMPRELRLMIYDELLATSGTNLEIACCSYHADIFKWEDDPVSHDNLSQTRQTCNTLARLLRTNREIYSEVTPVLYSATTFHFCIDLYCGQPDSRATGPQLLGYGGVEFSCYPNQYEPFIKLAIWTKNVQVARLHLELPSNAIERHVPGNIRLQLWESRDNLRATILYFNKLRHLQDLGLLCTMEPNEEVGELPDMLVNYLRPIQHLNSAVKLIILFAYRNFPERLQEVKESHQNFDHIHSLQDPGRRWCAGHPRSLLHEWLKVRTWCIRTFTFFHIELQPTVGDGIQHYEDINADVVEYASKALEQIWDAHDQGNHTEFEAAKSVLHEVWTHNYRIYDHLLQDLPGSKM